MDIIPSTQDVALGTGWDRLETYRGENFRWVSNDAVLHVAVLKRVDHQVLFQIEPGPGVGLKPFTLKVSDETGAAIAELDVKGRQTVSFSLPISGPRVFSLKLHTSDGGKTAPNDPRVLNFRVFKIEIKRLAADVVVAGSGLRLGAGWYPLETFGGESFRWVNNDAVIEVGTDASRTLELEVEPGPGLDLKPFTLVIYDQAGNQIQSLPVSGRVPLTVKIPDALRLPASIRLHVDGGGKSSNHDARIMNFRVFEANPMLALAGG
jgi:hypothetical protein